MAPSVDVQTGSAEIYFAKKLANNERKVRDKALRKLKLWLKTRATSEAELDELELLKLWKGLFYCMWFSDKPLVQEELADSLAQLVHIFPRDKENGILFSSVFFTTIGREWLGIDRLRLDKFYMLVKNFIRELLVYLRNSKWCDTLVSTANSFFSKHLLDEKYPSGLKMYYAEKIIPELMEVYSDSKECTASNPDILLKLMEPYFSALALSKSDAVIRTIRDEVFESLLSARFTYNVDDKKKLLFKVPFCQIADRLCELGAQKNVQTKNRKILFLYVDKYRKYAEQLEVAKNKRKRKRKKKLESVDTKEIDVLDEEETDQQRKKIKKKKKKVRNGGDNITESNTSEQNTQVTESTKKMDAKTDIVDDVDFVIRNDDENVESPLKVKKRKKKHTKALLDTVNQDNTINDEVSTEIIDSTPGNGDEVKLKLNFLSTDDANQVTSDKIIINNEPLIVECNKETDLTEKSKPVDMSLSSKKKKKSKKKLSSDDDPQPVVSFVKTPTPHAFFRKTLMKSEPPRKKKRILNEDKPVLSTPMSERKKVRIDVTKNTSVAAKDLKIRPTTPFSPTRKPRKSIVKTPLSARAKASDFF